MPVTTTTRLTAAQWRLVNLLHRRPAGAKGWRATSALRAVDASREDLAELVEYRFALARVPHVEHPIRDLDRIDLSTVSLWIDTEGKMWAQHNPHNRALLCIADADRAGITLHTALRRTDVHRLVFVDLAEAGLVTIVDREIGEPSTPAHGQNPKGFTVTLTHKGWARLAV